VHFFGVGGRGEVRPVTQERKEQDMCVKKGAGGGGEGCKKTGTEHEALTQGA